MVTLRTMRVVGGLGEWTGLHCVRRSYSADFYAPYNVSINEGLLLPLSAAPLVSGVRRVPSRGPHTPAKPAPLLFRPSPNRKQTSKNPSHLCLISGVYAVNIHAPDDAFVLAQRSVLTCARGEIPQLRWAFLCFLGGKGVAG